MISWDFLLIVCPCHVFKDWISHLFALISMPVHPLSVLHYQVLTIENYISQVPLPKWFLLDLTNKRYLQKIGRREGQRSQSIYTSSLCLSSVSMKLLLLQHVFSVIPTFRERLFIHGLSSYLSAQLCYFNSAS